jgi:hypothetical protein
MTLTRAREVFDQAIALGRRSVNWHEVVVVEVDPPRADFGKQGDRIVRRQAAADDVAERVAPLVAHGPEAERELVFGPRFVLVRHGRRSARCRA